MRRHVTDVTRRYIAAAAFDGEAWLWEIRRLLDMDWALSTDEYWCALGELCALFNQTRLAVGREAVRA